MCARPRRDDSHDEELHRLLFHVARGLHRQGPPPAELRAAFHSAGLGPRHVGVLAQLATDGPLTVGELAERLRVSLAHASLMVGALTRAGLAERREDDLDRRRTIVTVAERYADQIREWLAARVEPLRRVLRQLSPEERESLLRALRLLDDELTGSERCAKPLRGSPRRDA
jgi:DNA-binding MarR family transcriptional regulator